MFSYEAIPSLYTNKPIPHPKYFGNNYTTIPLSLWPYQQLEAALFYFWGKF